MLVILSVFAFFLAYDMALAIMSALEFNAAWKGFKVCRNGAVYNVRAKRFATKAERKSLPCLADFA